MSNVAIDVRDVVKTFDEGRTRALDGATMQVEAGEFAALTGPSGCGKSTLLHAIAALEKPDSGSIVVQGEDVWSQRDLSRYRARTVGLVFQLHNLLPNLTAIENVQVPMYELALSMGQRRQRAEELLELVGLRGRASNRPAELSGGERQRVAIARALSNEPRVLLADEPTGSLDSKATAHVIAMLREIQRSKGVTLLLVSHDLGVASAGDRVIEMLDGRVVNEGRRASAAS
jgi:putative ABC transport system ATP-binding protein